MWLKYSYIFLCGLAVGFSVPLTMGLVKPNSQFGLRTAKTLSDPHIWEVTNRFGGWAIIIAAFVGLALISTIVNYSQKSMAIAVVLLCLPFWIAIAVTLLYAGRF